MKRRQGRQDVEGINLRLRALRDSIPNASEVLAVQSSQRRSGDVPNVWVCVVLDYDFDRRLKAAEDAAGKTRLDSGWTRWSWGLSLAVGPSIDEALASAEKQVPNIIDYFGQTAPTREQRLATLVADASGLLTKTDVTTDEIREWIREANDALKPGPK